MLTFCTAPNRPSNRIAKILSSTAVKDCKQRPANVEIQQKNVTLVRSSNLNGVEDERCRLAPSKQRKLKRARSAREHEVAMKGHERYKVQRPT